MWTSQVFDQEADNKIIGRVSSFLIRGHSPFVRTLPPEIGAFDEQETKERPGFSFQEIVWKVASIDGNSVPLFKGVHLEKGSQSSEREIEKVKTADPQLSDYFPLNPFSGRWLRFGIRISLPDRDDWKRN